MKKNLALLTALVILSAVALTVPAMAEAPAYNPDAIIYIYSTDDPTHLDPSLATDGQSTVVTGLLFNSLVGYNRDGSIFPDVAESWTVSDDGLTYTFKIRDGIKFHDGTVCDAYAVEWNWNRVIPWNATPEMTYSTILFGNVESFEATDASTFAVTLKTRDSTFLTLQGSSSLAAALLSPAAYEADPEGADRNPVGTGPYKFVELKAGQYVRAERYDDYHRGVPSNGGVIIRIIPESSTAVSELMTGGLDYVGSLAADQVDLLRSAQGVEVITTPSQNLSILSFADYEKNPLFSDKRVRQAVREALDLESINKALYGDAMVTAISPIPPGMQSGVRDDYVNYPYDPEHAKELLAEAGYPDGITATMLTYNVVKGYNPAGEQLAVQIQAELAKAGINIEIKILPWGEFVEVMYTDPVEGYDMLLHGWGADYFDTSNIIFLWSEEESGGGANHPGYVDEEFEAIFKAAKESSDYNEAGELYAQAAQKIQTDLPSIITGHGVQYTGFSPKLANGGDILMSVAGNHTWQLQKAD
ncbi:MAG: ABC transporter substrate-binding protein [Oscillospiraceae bacterium]|jgi:peptide/nickel transport system substrate-binding protein|nr:ABC transporter substrate-binding protein [Oscillospiraceae bacterium]